MKSAAVRTPQTNARPSAEGEPAPAAFLDGALRSRSGAAHTVVVAVPAPVVPLADAWQLTRRDTAAFLWEPPEGPGLVGWGEAQVLTPDGLQRGAQARRGAEHVASDLEAVYHAAVPQVPPRWLGGLSFAPGTAAEGPWSAFGDGRFVLPRWCYGRQGDRAWLALAMHAGALDGAARAEAGQALRAHLDVLAGLAARADAPDDRAPDPAPLQATHLARGPWDAQVHAIRRAIESGALDKVVAARCSTVHAPAAIDPARVMARLGASYPGCTRFAVRSGAATFLGATPERLVSREGHRVVSEAMAGSVPHGASAELLASEKDRREHDLVVAAIVERLGPFCRTLDKGTEPRVRELPNVVHLHTPVTGHLSGPVHVLDLVDALHPTPAVGGVPADRAVDWIVAHEPTPRGWYAGPVGWFDAEGDGEFVVALRSGLLRGDRAWAYAGAGIVRGSSPDAEYAETSLKLRPVLGALGSTPADTEP
jgi:isochorismate synthase